MSGPLLLRCTVLHRPQDVLHLVHDPWPRGTPVKRRERPRRRASDQGNELTPCKVEHGDSSPMPLSEPPTGSCSVFRSFSLPQGGRQVLGANLKCSESSRRRPAPR
jgi:hypothetical protein